VVVSGAAPAGKHPSLVKADGTVCATCHEALFAGKPGVHPAAEMDCTSCHSVSIGADGTQIGLVASGTDLCVTCHDGQAKGAAGDVKVPHAPVLDSCLNCHDPHASAEPSLLSAPAASLCGGCHDAASLAPAHGGQITPAVSCVGCHVPHGSDTPRMLIGTTTHRPFAEKSCAACHLEPSGDRIRLRARGEKLCTACHSDLAAPAPEGGSLHAALKGEKGRAGCLNCHDPHMAKQAKLLVAEGPALCASCHDAVVKAGKASGHVPVESDCGLCHQPHVASQPKLLASPPADLCSTCHDTSDADLSKKHLGADPAKLACTACHNPHGAGNAKLLARHLHAAVELGCDTCHEGAADKLQEGGESPLCLTCHAEVGEKAAAAKVPHPALDVARCADCHNPHASAQPRLVREPGGAVCTECHSEQAAGAGEFAHGAIEVVGCQACHEPHGGDGTRMLRLEGDELCLACHDPGKVEIPKDAPSVTVMGRFEIPAGTARAMATLRLTRDGTEGHPFPGHRARGTPTPEELRATDSTFQGPLACGTCHDPHKGRSPELFRWSAASSAEACNHCHEKK